MAPLGFREKIMEGARSYKVRLTDLWSLERRDAQRIHRVAIVLLLLSLFLLGVDGRLAFCVLMLISLGWAYFAVRHRNRCTIRRQELFNEFDGRCHRLTEAAMKFEPLKARGNEFLRLAGTTRQRRRMNALWNRVTQLHSSLRELGRTIGDQNDRSPSDYADDLAELELAEAAILDLTRDYDMIAEKQAATEG